MASRTYLIPAVILWLASTSWLISTKILPTLTAGKPPVYADLLPKTADKPAEPVRWTIRWNGDDIGWAENKISRRPDGTGTIESEVRFEQLPVDRILKDVMGVLGRFANALHGDLGPVELRVLTVFDFDHYGALHRFDTTVDVAEMRNLLKIEGHVAEETVHLVAKVAAGQKQEVVSKKEFRVPPEALLADSFSPRPRFSNLRVGQKWTFQSYRPLLPHRPLELIEATVEREELVQWRGAMVRARKVVYRQDAGSGLSSTRRPMSELWVKRDGTVLRQDLWIASIRVQFIRQPTSSPSTSPTAAAVASDTDLSPSAGQ